MKEKVVLSGIRATGKLHLGNYLGAMRNFVILQETSGYKCLYFIADYHTLTTNPNPKDIKSNLPQIVLDYLAAGIDSEKSILYAQSSVPELAELCLLLGMVMPIGELQRCPTFKEKAKKQSDNVNHGLFSYPILMAADIIGTKANLVPVGEDQLVHLEITRSIAQRFNNRYGETFELPEALKGKAIRVPGLDGTAKMGKSDNNTIDLTDSPEMIWMKLSTAVTDAQRQRRSDPGSPSKCNIYSLHKFVSEKELIAEVKEGCKTAKMGCVDCKKRLSTNIIGLLEPFQERRENLSKNPDYIHSILNKGGEQARKIVQETVSEVREKMGLRMF